MRSPFSTLQISPSSPYSFVTRARCLLDGGAALFISTSAPVPPSHLSVHRLRMRTHLTAHFFIFLRLVLETLEPLPGDRKCFRLINGVLVERTVKDVVPALKTNQEGLRKVLDDLVKQYKSKQDELDKWKVSPRPIILSVITWLTSDTEKEQCAGSATIRSDAKMTHDEAPTTVLSPSIYLRVPSRHYRLEPDIDPEHAPIAHLRVIFSAKNI